MFVRTVKSGENEYLRIVEGYRDPNSGKVKQRVLQHLGRLDREGKVEKALENWVNRANESDGTTENQPKYFSAKEYGNVMILQKIWEQIGLDKAIRSGLRATKRDEVLTEALIRLMVFCQLCAPSSKRGVLRWLREVNIPDISNQVSHQKLLRAMDALDHNVEVVRNAVSSLIRPLIDQEMTLAVYDLTTVRFFGKSDEEDDLRQVGKSKDTGGFARQIVFGVVQTNDGIPLMFQVHPGNTAEPKTLIGMAEQLTKQYPIRRIVTIADRGLLTAKNIQNLVNFKTIEGQTLQFILAVPMRRHQQELKVIGEMQFDDDGVQESSYLGQRLIVSYKKQYARDQGATRQRKITELMQEADEKIFRLQTRKVRKEVHDQKAFKEFRNKVKSKGLSRIVKASINKNNQFVYHIDMKALELAESFDGKLGILTNVPDMAKDDVVDHYNQRSDIESGFRTLKSELKIAPVFHRLPARIKSHGLICFLALLLYRMVRMRLRAKGISASASTVLELLRDIKQIELELNGKKQIEITEQTPEQMNFISALEENITNK